MLSLEVVRLSEVGPLANSLCAGNASLPVLAPPGEGEEGTAKAVRELTPTFHTSARFPPRSHAMHALLEAGKVTTDPPVQVRMGAHRGLQRDWP